MGARPWAARTSCEWAETLLLRDGPGDRERAAELLAKALDTAGQLGMTPLLERAATLSESGGDKLLEADRPEATRTAPPDGEYWSVAYRRDAFRLKDSKGLRYLARLLGEPGREVHALDLVAGERDAGIASRRTSRDSRRPAATRAKSSTPGQRQSTAVG